MMYKQPNHFPDNQHHAELAPEESMVDVLSE
jgi:hypothetical protein